MDSESIRQFVREIPDFPKPGVSFKDITPVLANPEAFASVIDGLTDQFVNDRIDCVLGLEARGFIFGAPVAYRLGASFVPVRKSGKLPFSVESVTYQSEYGSAIMEVHSDAVAIGQNCLIVDDVLATGGTAVAACDLVEKLGGRVAGISVFIELAALNGRKLLGERQVASILRYE